MGPRLVATRARALQRRRNAKTDQNTAATRKLPMSECDFMSAREGAAPTLCLVASAPQGRGRLRRVPVLGKFWIILRRSRLATVSQPSWPPPDCEGSFLVSCRRAEWPEKQLPCDLPCFGILPQTLDPKQHARSSGSAAASSVTLYTGSSFELHRQQPTPGRGRFLLARQALVLWCSCRGSADAKVRAT